MESIKDKVAIIGMGTTQFGELWDKSVDDLIIDAVTEALEDAGVETKDIQAAWLGTFDSGYTGQVLSSPLQLQYIPVTRVENACATGIEAIRNASFALMAKAYDLVLVVGVEKMKDVGFGGLYGAPGVFHPVYGVQASAVGRYALAATRYFERYGIKPEDGKRLLAMISSKSHYNGARNPKAHLRREVSVDEVMNAPIIAWPLGLLDCCGVTDGASAAVLCRAEDAKDYKKSDEYITIKGMGVAVGPGWGKERSDYDYTHWPETEVAAKMAYAQAGIKDPRKELDLAEVHDCFSIAELIAIESLGFCEHGKAKEDIEAGSFTLEGDLPVNPSGGLKSFGHPIGASGCREISELYNQMLGRADLPERQLKNPKLGLVHNQGGHPGRFMAGVCIVGLP
ncbi:MAG: acetyl-CoA acetyltransferase [Deltaproteobacteria bacterium]|nr:MAG: acetyl-CoA acetyltransferase [Deltaproteobacteria bacterium]